MRVIRRNGVKQRFASELNDQENLGTLTADDGFAMPNGTGLLRFGHWAVRNLEEKPVTCRRSSIRWKQRRWETGAVDSRRTGVRA